MSTAFRATQIAW